MLLIFRDMSRIQNFSGKYVVDSYEHYFLFIIIFSFYCRKPDKNEAELRREREEISKRHEDR